jgi:hypothetical protein
MQTRNEGGAVQRILIAVELRDVRDHGAQRERRCERETIVDLARARFSLTRVYVDDSFGLKRGLGRVDDVNRETVAAGRTDLA